MPPKILIAPTTFCVFDSLPERRLIESGFELVKNVLGRKLTPAELSELGRDCVGVIAGTEQYSAAVLPNLPLLRTISRVGVGMDNIDFAATNERNIVVKRTETGPTSAVAELALGLILDGLRRISHQNRQMKAGQWEKTMGSLLEGKTLGIIGLGKIGRKLVSLTKPFGLTYLASDLHPDHAYAKENGVTFCALERLLSESDVVSIHLSPTPEATNLIDFAKLKLMKPHSVIVNTSRGEVVNEEALVRALKEDIIGCAALDVFETEPYAGPLLGLDNAIVVPHIGAYAKELRTRMELEAVDNLLAALGATPLNGTAR